MEVGKLVRGVTVGHVERPGLVWISAPPTEQSDKLLKEVEMMSLEQWPGSTKPTVGTLVAVRFSEDGLIYRAKVESIDDSVLIVRFIDYGNTEQKTLKEIFRLPASLAKDAGLAVLVEVVGAESTKDSPKNRDRVAAKLSKPNLDVLLSTSATTHGLLRGEFSYNGKLVTFSKKSEARKAEADTGVEEDEVLNVPPVKDAEEVKVEPEVIVEAADEEVLDVPPVNLNKGFSKMKEQFEDIQAPLMFASLPRLALLDGVRTTGNVVFVSPEARVWFSPLWAQEKLTEVSQVIDALAERDCGLDPVQPQEGMLCIARSEDGCLYRARVTKFLVEVPDGVTVQFIDFGNSETVEVVYQYPACLGLELAPAAAEVVLARSLLSTGELKKKVLEDCLMGEEEETSLELQLERDKETGMQVARFYEDGLEVTFDNKIEPVPDVLVEAEEREIPKATVEPDVNKNFTSEELKVRRPLVEAEALPKVGNIPVVLVLVEDVRKVWVIRKELEQKLDKMAEALQRQASKLEAVENPGVGCVYATKFSQDQQIYRAVVEKAEGDMVTVRFIDFGNREIKDKSELVQLTEKMAKWPAVAHPIILEENKDAEDSQANRDEVEEVLDQDLELVLKEGRLVKLESGGKPVTFSFNRKSATKGKDAVEANKKVKTGLEKPVTELKGPDEEISKVRKVEEVTTPVKKLVEGATVSITHGGKKRSSTATTPSSGSTGESPMEVFDRMEEVIADQVKPTCEKSAGVGEDHVRVNTCVSGKVELMEDLAGVKGSQPTSALRSAGDSAEPAVVNYVKESNKARHNDKSTYIPPALRRAAQSRDQSSERCPEVSPGTVAALKSMLEKELPQVTRGKGDGEEKVVKPLSYGTKKVNDWFARNEAVRLKEAAVTNNELLADENFDAVEAPLGSSSPCKKKEDPNEAGGVEGDLALESLNRMLKHAPAAALMTTRETSVTLQELVPLLPASALQPLFDGASDNFEMVSTHPSGCRVIQVLLKSNCSSDQLDQLNCHLIDEPASLIRLAMDKFGTFVAQESLNHMVKTPGAVLGVVKAIRGKMSQLGSNLHASFFLQKLLEVARGEASTFLLQEEILVNIRLLAFSEAGSRLVQAVLQNCSMSSVVRVAHWLEMCMQEVVRSGPATFTAIGVLDRVMEKAKSEKEWLVILERLATALLVSHSDADQPLLVVAALHPEAHLLAREVVARTKLLTSSRAPLLCVLQHHVELLRCNKTGAGVLKALRGAV